MNRIVAHLDMDAFFAAIEERDNPRFAGLPIVIGADPDHGRGRGVVSTANYAARAYGIGSGQPIRRAWRLAELARQQGKTPALFLPGSWRHYGEVSDRIMALLRGAVPLVEQRSVDEMYLDLSFTGSIEAAATFARELKQELFRQEQLTSSVGIGPNKLIAKIASDVDKPNGLTIVDESVVLDFLAPLPIRAIPGIGPKTAAHFFKLGIVTIEEARRFSEDELQAILGTWGRDLFAILRGRDEAPVTEDYERKSIGRERTFSHDVYSCGVVVDEMVKLAAQVWEDLQEAEYMGARVVVIKIRFADFATVSSRHTCKEYISSVRMLQQEALKLLLPFLDKRRNPLDKALRLVGVRLEKLHS